MAFPVIPLILIAAKHAGISVVAAGAGTVIVKKGREYAAGQKALETVMDVFVGSDKNHTAIILKDSAEMEEVVQRLSAIENCNIMKDEAEERGTFPIEKDNNLYAADIVVITPKDQSYKIPNVLNGLFQEMIDITPPEAHDPVTRLADVFGERVLGKTRLGSQVVERGTEMAQKAINNIGDLLRPPR